MDYMQKFADEQIAEAFGLFRPEFGAKLFPGGLVQAQSLAAALAATLFPGTDCTAAHYQTCFDFYSTYAFTRLMGYSTARAQAACRSKYAGLPEEQYEKAFACCGEQVNVSFPTLTEPTETREDNGL